MTTSCITSPAYSDNSVAICCTTSDHYALYCGVTLASIINHASPENHYEVFILESGLHKKNKDKLLGLLSLAQAKNIRISIQFVNVGEFIKDRQFYTRLHFTPECYYSFFAASIFPCYDKVLYLDVDLIAQCDLAQLYFTDIGENWIAGCKDAALVNLCLNAREDENYYRTTLGVDPYHEYFNSGVLLLNLRKWREEDVENRLFEALVEIPNPRWIDQDILNKVCHGHVFFLNLSWNRSPEYHNIKAPFTPELRKEYFEDDSIPGIIHYYGIKPWHLQSSVRRCDEWWAEARSTLFCEEIIHYSLHEAIKNANKTTRGLINKLSGEFKKFCANTQEKENEHKRTLTIQNDRIAKLCEEYQKETKAHAKTKLELQKLRREYEKQQKMVYVASHLMRARFMKWHFWCKKLLHTGYKRQLYADKWYAMGQLIQQAIEFKKAALKI